MTGSIKLEDFIKLKTKDVEVLTEVIKHWFLYGNGKPAKLGIKSINGEPFFRANQFLIPASFDVV